MKKPQTRMTRKKYSHKIANLAKANKREQAIARQILRDNRSALEQLALCKSRRGSSLKEIARLKAIIKRELKKAIKKAKS